MVLYKGDQGTNHTLSIFFALKESQNEVDDWDKRNLDARITTVKYAMRFCRKKNDSWGR